MDIQHSNEFDMFCVSGDFIGGAPRNQDGWHSIFRLVAEATLGGTAGAMELRAGGANFGDQNGGDVVLRGGQGSGTGQGGQIICDGNLLLQDSVLEDLLEA